MKTSIAFIACVACFLSAGCGGGGGGGGGAVGVPTPAPSHSPGRIIVTPSQVQLLKLPDSSVFTAFEPNYSGSFTAQVSDQSVATVTSGPGSDQFTVTAVSVGLAVVFVDDTLGNQAIEPVSVTTSSVGAN